MAGDEISCKWLLTGMGAFVLLLIAWIKTLLKENSDSKDARIADLKEQASKVQKGD